MKRYWKISADNLSKADWSWGCVSTINSNGQTIFVADAHRGEGKRFIVRADEKLTAFLELEAAITDRETRCLAAAHGQEVVKNCQHECASHVKTETVQPLEEFC